MKQTSKIEFSWENEVYSELIEGNLSLSEISLPEARIAMNRATGRYAFYGALLADILRKKSKVETEFDHWYSLKFSKISDDAPKGSTETWKKGQVVIQFYDEYKSWKDKLSLLENLASKANILRSAFKLQAQILQTVGYTLSSELKFLADGIEVGRKDFTE